jgi:hypothetical protein
MFGLNGYATGGGGGMPSGGAAPSGLDELQDEVGRGATTQLLRPVSLPSLGSE